MVEALLPWVVLVIGCAVTVYTFLVLGILPVILKVMAGVLIICSAGGAVLALAIGVFSLISMLVFQSDPAPAMIRLAVIFTAVGSVGTLGAIATYKLRNNLWIKVASNYLQKWTEGMPDNFPT